MDRLAEFIRREAARSYAWGDANCGLLIANWVAEVKGSDPFALWRAWAASQEKLFRRDPLRLPRLVARVAERAGLSFTRTPETGDIAVLRLGERAVCAIRSGDFWLMHLEDGVASVRAGRIPMFGAWRI